MGEKRESGGEAPMRRMTFRAAGRTEEFFDRLQAHYRECGRRDTDVDAELRVILEDGTQFDSGVARVRNVSATGALLVDVKLRKGSYPAGKFSLELSLTSGGYKGIGFRATPVRFVLEEQGIGVKFDEIFVTGPGVAGESGAKDGR